MIKKQTIYVAGPMRGYEDFNYPAFHEAERILESIGWDVVNPAKMDAEELDKKWEKSRGALAEWHLAKALGIKIYYEPRYPHV